MPTSEAVRTCSWKAASVLRVTGSPSSRVAGPRSRGGRGGLCSTRRGLLLGWTGPGSASLQQQRGGLQGVGTGYGVGWVPCGRA